MSKRERVEVAVIPFHNLVLYPTAAIPLYVYDPAYTRLVEDCLNCGRPVALALSDVEVSQSSLGSNRGVQEILYPRKICGMGEIILLQDYPDESKYILVQGIGKIELGQVIQEVPYLICEAFVLRDEEKTQTTFAGNPIERLRGLLEAWVVQNITDPDQRSLFTENLSSPQHVVDYLATFLLTDRDTKQMLLESQILSERIQMMNLLLQQASPFHENQYFADILKSYAYVDKTGSNDQ